jgi:SpoVK/Ycf46/Vps4 family AAA+-type ATPase
MLFEGHLGCERLEGRNYLAIALNATDSEVSAALNGKLAQIGILESDRGTSVCLEESFHQLLHTASYSDLKTDFFKKVDPEAVSLESHVVDSKATEYLLTLLGSNTKSSTHVLLYGAPGTGKTSYALGLAQRLGLPVYLVEHSGKARHSKRRFAFTACVNMASRGEDSIIIADDCDAVLNTRNSWALFGETSNKRWLHDILETPGVRMIWTVNSTQQIEESVARRFSFSVGFKAFSVAQRIQLWESILKTHNLEGILEASQVKDLAKRYQISPGIIDQSVRKAGETGCNSRDALSAALNLSLEAQETLAHGGSKPKQIRLEDPNFTLEGLNASGTDLKSLITELRVYAEHLKTKTANDGSTMALLFHGPSGTGKSHFAGHLGLELDKEVILKRGSDLLSMWVGGTEQNIKAAYEEATAREAILIFDEADSLIFTRDRAVRSWEISHTNEFLTWMEQFPGIQIFTTNRLSDLDKASLRRFNHKIEFRYLNATGNVIFYKRLLLPLLGSRMASKIEAQLKKIPRLAPGDFKVVRDRFKFRNRNEISHDALIEALKEESTMKSIHAGEKAIGF